MSEFAQAAGEGIAAIGSLMEAQSHAKNARELKRQAKAASAEGYADEEAQRRDARQFFGLQAAAMAEGGSGYGGSNELIIRQSAALAELDALNIRHQARKVRKSLMFQKRQEVQATRMSYMEFLQHTMGAGG